MNGWEYVVRQKSERPAILLRCVTHKFKGLPAAVLLGISLVVETIRGSYSRGNLCEGIGESPTFTAS